MNRFPFHGQPHRPGESGPHFGPGFRKLQEHKQPGLDVPEVVPRPTILGPLIITAKAFNLVSRSAPNTVFEATKGPVERTAELDENDFFENEQDESYLFVLFDRPFERRYPTSYIWVEYSGLQDAFLAYDPVCMRNPWNPSTLTWNNMPETAAFVDGAYEEGVYETFFSFYISTMSWRGGVPPVGARYEMTIAENGQFTVGGFTQIGNPTTGHANVEGLPMQGLRFRVALGSNTIATCESINDVQIFMTEP